MNRVCAIVLLVLAAGCLAPARVATLPGVDFSRIKTIAVLDPEREDLRGITDEFVRQLMARGYTLRVGADGVPSPDAWLQVNVGRMIPDKKYLIPIRSKDGQDVLVMNPVTEISGRSLYPSATTAGLQDAQVVVSNATLSLSVRLLDPVSRNVWWTGSMTYEGLDLDAAVEGSVTALLKRFPNR